MRAPRHDSKPLNRLVNLLLLLGWLLSSHGVAPAVCMAAALLDGDHEVKIGVSNNGAMAVVLTHEGKSAAELISHQHDALCRMLMAFAKTPASNAGDHVLAFKPVDDAARAQRLATAGSCEAKMKAPVEGVLCFYAAKPACHHGIVWQVRHSTWSQGQSLKTGRVVMRC
ncbi:hypothetical protein [Prosthecobacter vanneervenii]|uniref:Uncharacterized protein n=1 Tax=Prosthecobacter vanneervenii TaxID=48466 RepID=A0A7W7YDZ4_9BACT|nr:hypothetical protein [Prosthecobacter vanneervenii]MBB5034432.1 hypothetical protein [Prosthecobacter vanneervenii]